MTRQITVDHVSRLEGHGRIIVEIGNGKVENVKFSFFEGPRFFEALVVGRHYGDVPMLVSRICAICSVGHKLTSILALEDALGVVVSRQTELLRELLFHGMFIESHTLHTYFLAAPDFLGAGSAIELAPRFPKEVQRALQLKKFGNQIQELVGGRAIHPVNPVVGGFGRIPTVPELEEIRAGLEKWLPEAEETVMLFASLDYPKYTVAPTLFYAVDPGKTFGYFGNQIVSSEGEVIPMKSYKQVTEEKVMPYTSAKHSLPKGRTFLTGALARVNLFADRLPPKTAAAVRKTGWGLPSNNSLQNNLAQAVELMYSVERSMEVIDELFKLGVKAEGPAPVVIREGHGVAGTEVPRGTLYHEYVLDKDGKVTYANVVTPTAQNQPNIERDMVNCVNSMVAKDDKEIGFNLEVIARAYDPCISCAAHLVEVRRRD